MKSLSCFVLSGLVAIATTQTINLPKVTRVKLANGATVVTMPYKRAPFVSVRVVFPGGQILEQPGQAGVATLTAGLLTQGAAGETAPQIAEQVDFLGARLSGVSSVDAVVVRLDLLSKDVDAGLALLAKVVREPMFTEEEVERRKLLLISSLRTIAESPEAIADRLATGVVFENHPYGSQPTVTSVSSLTRQDVVRYYDRALKPNDMIITAVGDFSSSAMQAKLNAIFGSWPRKEDVALPKATVSFKPPRKAVVDKPDATQTQVRLIRSGLPRNSPDFYAADVASAAMGAGFTSRLADEIRVNRQLTYGIDSPFSFRLLGGSFQVTTFTRAEATKEMLDALNEVMHRTARSGFTAAELLRVKGYLAGQFASSIQTPEALAGRLADIELYDLPRDYLTNYIANFQKVTLNRVNAMARNFFAPEKLSVILVGPLATIRPLLGSLGKYEEVELDTITR